MKQGKEGVYRRDLNCVSVVLYWDSPRPNHVCLKPKVSPTSKRTKDAYLFGHCVTISSVIWG